MPGRNIRTRSRPADPDRAVAVAVARRFDSGEVYVNGGRFNIDAPFGGVKESGYGRELGPLGILEFKQTKAPPHLTEPASL
ncbi:aldehyde dehydrogenase family protein [Actinomadura montaniterrae]|uniref:aldehyde dehydrogenase family protein n=1 Tax=Actinomadura montaniterrae TaxID=1803903 RepID=UPI001CEF6544|nr:aldehyde dehydrogenase family protein [Actinomadura montaniterrae]